MRSPVQRLVPYLYVAPAAALTVVFSLLAMGVRLWVSFLTYDAFAGGAGFWGLANYRRALLGSDSYFWLALWNTTYYVLMSVAGVLLTTMMLPPAVVLIPRFLALRELGLVDTFMGAWNMFEWPLVVLSNQDYYLLTVGLSLFRAESWADWPRVFAARVMGSVPLILLFLAAQRYLVGGINLSGMKG